MVPMVDDLFYMSCLYRGGCGICFFEFYDSNSSMNIFLQREWVGEIDVKRLFEVERQVDVGVECSMLCYVQCAPGSSAAKWPYI